MPWESLLTSKAIVPVRPAKSNGCLGYMASAVTVPPSLTVSTSCPLQTWMSLGGLTRAVLPHVDSCAAAQSLAEDPKFWLPVDREAPHTVPSSWPSRSLAGLTVGPSLKVSQNAGVAPGAEANAGHPLAVSTALVVRLADSGRGAADSGRGEQATTTKPTIKLAAPNSTIPWAAGLRPKVAIVRRWSGSRFDTSFSSG